jgi:hypothetical protein
MRHVVDAEMADHILNHVWPEPGTQRRAELEALLAPLGAGRRHAAWHTTPPWRRPRRSSAWWPRRARVATGSRPWRSGRKFSPSPPHGWWWTPTSAPRKPKARRGRSGWHCAARLDAVRSAGRSRGVILRREGAAGQLRRPGRGPFEYVWSFRQHAPA